MRRIDADDGNNTITWARWSVSEMKKLRVSRVHIIDRDREGLTLCGHRIPQDGDGVEYVEDAEARACRQCEWRASDETA